MDVDGSRESRGRAWGWDQQSRASAAFRWGWLRCVADVSRVAREGDQGLPGVPSGRQCVVFELRRYQDADAERVWYLHEAGLRQMDGRAGGGPWDDDLRAVPATYLANGGEFLVGVLDGELVATRGATSRIADGRADQADACRHPLPEPGVRPRDAASP